MNYGEGKIQTFFDLNAWKEGHQLVLSIYKTTGDFPREELFGLVSQMRRCVVSITSNLAEGFSRNSFKDKLQFYAIALGSVTELQNQMLISKDLGFISEEKYNEIMQRSITVHKLINGLIKKSKSIIHTS
ncbi:MAG TPA: four helix bundle protein [bacterium]|nr:four helix bundle protein [bacterium]